MPAHDVGDPGSKRPNVDGSVAGIRFGFYARAECVGGIGVERIPFFDAVGQVRLEIAVAQPVLHDFDERVPAAADELVGAS